MRGIFWNSRGLRDLAKHDFLCSTSLEKDLGFIALLETHRSFSDENLNTFCGSKEFSWHWIPPNGRSRGVLLRVNAAVFEVQSSLSG
jgi:hypothetical protein